VLIAASAADERATTAHRAKLAYVYVRQSSLNQVKHHHESTELQYRLVERAVALGCGPLSACRSLTKISANRARAAWSATDSRS
jgi:hypothetical protein